MQLAGKLVRATVYGLLIGILFVVMFYCSGVIMNAFGITQIEPKILALIGFIFGFSAPLAVEFSKDINEQKQK